MRWLLALPCRQISGIKFPQFRLRPFARPASCSEITCLGGERFLPHKQRRRGRLYQVSERQDEFWASGSDYANFGEQQGEIGICGTKPQKLGWTPVPGSHRRPSLTIIDMDFHLEDPHKCAFASLVHVEDHSRWRSIQIFRVRVSERDSLFRRFGPSLMSY